MRTWAILAALTVLAGFIHLMPSIVSGVPYGTDSWELLKAASSFPPANTAAGAGFAFTADFSVPVFFSYALSSLSGSSPERILPLVFPMLSCLTVLIVFVISRSLTQSTSTSLLASLFVGVSALPGVLYSGVTGEGFAVNLALLAIFILFCKDDWSASKRWAAASTVLLGLGLSREVFAVYVGVILLAVISGVLLKVKSKEEVFYAVALVAFSVVVLYAFSPRSIQLGLSLVSPSLVGVACLGMAGFYFLETRGYSFSSRRRLDLLLTFSTSVAFTFLALFSLVLGTQSVPRFPLDAVLLMVPFVALGALAVFGLRHFSITANPRTRALVDPWLLLLAGGLTYTVFFSSQSVLAVRLAGQLFIPMALLCAVTLSPSSLNRFHKGPKLAVAAGAAALVLMLAFPFYWVPFGSGTYGGSQLVYSPSDLATMTWLRQHGGSTSGDYRYSYLAVFYDVTYGNLLTLQDIETRGHETDTFLLSQAYYARGYFPGGLANLKLPHLDATILPGENLVYSNMKVKLYSFRS